MPDPDPLRHPDSADHVLGRVRSVLWHHVQVRLTMIMTMMMIMIVNCRGVNITLRLLQDVFKVDRGVDW